MRASREHRAFFVSLGSDGDDVNSHGLGLNVPINNWVPPDLDAHATRAYAVY
jgi:hypothetical protein